MNVFRTFSFRLFLASLTLAFAVSCSTCPLGCGPKKGQVEHVVLIWLKKPGDKADRARIIEQSHAFKAQIPDIQSLSAGQVLPSEREIVDDSFDVGLVIRFADKAAMDRYEKHPVHQKAVKEVLMPLSKKVVVYDFVRE